MSKRAEIQCSDINAGEPHLETPELNFNRNAISLILCNKS